MSTHNICIRREIRKILCGYQLLSVAMDQPAVLCSLIRIFLGLILDSHSKDAKFLHVDNKDLIRLHGCAG